MEPNERRARPTCKKSATKTPLPADVPTREESSQVEAGEPSGDHPLGEVQIWEISDGESCSILRVLSFKICGRCDVIVLTSRWSMLKCYCP